MTEFVNVPVPADRVEEVYELLGRPRPGTTSTAAEQATGLLDASVDEALLVRAYRESPPAMKGVFDVLADRAGKEVLMVELAQAIDRKPNQVSGVLGAFGRRWKNRYKQQKWPFSATWDWDHSQMRYNMHPSSAKVVISQRGQ